MKNIDVLDLDGHLIRTLIVIFEEGSVSAAAQKLDIGQSTISHRLERLRQKLGDPLFVRAGRGIVPTKHAESIIPQALKALNAMQLLVETEQFSAQEMDETFVVAATDFERVIFLIDAYNHIRKQAPNFRMNFVWELYNHSTPLRNGTFDIAISPIENTGELDIKRRILFRDNIVCFYDPDMTDPPDTVEKYSNAKHVLVKFNEEDASFVDVVLEPLGIKRPIAISMPSISELPKLMKDTPLIATLPYRLKNSIMSDFSCCPAPFPMGQLTYSMFWHDRTHTSKKHAWLRKQIIDYAYAKDERKSIKI